MKICDFYWCKCGLMSTFIIEGNDKFQLKVSEGTSLVAQWLGIRLPMQGTQV